MGSDRDDSRGPLSMLDHLVTTLEGSLKRLQKEQLSPDDIQRYSQERWVYYVRTIEAPGKPPTPAWVASRLRWNFLRNRRIQGEHTVEKARDENGHFLGPGQVFQILGTLELEAEDREDYRDRKVHLHWDGVCWGEGGTQEERYYASFICAEADLKAGFIIGQWSGRTNSSRYNPGGGFMIIAPPDENPHLLDEKRSPLREKPSKKHSLKLLEELKIRADDFWKENPTLAGPPPEWEWQVLHCPVGEG